GGTTPGQRARVLLAPEHNFAFVLLTNSPGGSAIRNDLTAWVLDHYLGVRQTPRTRMDPPDGMLSNYSGIYGVRAVELCAEERLCSSSSMTMARRRAHRHHSSSTRRTEACSLTVILLI